MKRLYKSSTNRKIMGVCGGLAEYFNIDPVIIRAVFLILAFVYEFGFVAYIVLGLLLPYDYEVERDQQSGTRKAKAYRPKTKEFRWGTYEKNEKRKDVTPDKTFNKDDWSNF